jgi:hypothetical protein
VTRTFASAATLEDALDALGSGARLVAGGTDLVVGARQGKAPLPEAIVAIDRIDTLGGIVDVDGGLRLGALVTHDEIVSSQVPSRHGVLASQNTGPCSSISTSGIASVYSIEKYSQYSWPRSSLVSLFGVTPLTSRHDHRTPVGTKCGRRSSIALRRLFSHCFLIVASSGTSHLPDSSQERRVRGSLLHPATSATTKARYERICPALRARHVPGTDCANQRACELPANRHARQAET